MTRTNHNTNHHITTHPHAILMSSVFLTSLLLSRRTPIAAKTDPVLLFYIAPTPAVGDNLFYETTRYPITPFYAKQTQFLKRRNEHNPLSHIILQKFPRILTLAKQTQSNPIYCDPSPTDLSCEALADAASPQAPNEEARNKPISRTCKKCLTVPANPLKSRVSR